MARDTMPMRGGVVLRLCENVYWGLSLHSSNTTCTQQTIQTYVEPLLIYILGKTIVVSPASMSKTFKYII